MEIPYNQAVAERGCMKCGNGYRYVRTLESMRTSGGKSPYRNLVIALIVEFNILLGAVVYVCRPRRPGEEEVKQMRMRCHKCHQKIRYPENKIGWQGRCPRCKVTLTFTADGDDDDDDDDE
jgi:hypothetical protein